ncbi:MAG: shikimate dehydrogenase [Nitrospirae bacterium]|nr:shikimate dehydrogenase [Nitrospirota bacterium]
MKVTGKSKVFGIIGRPVSHSLSPVLHNAAFEFLGLDCCYVPFPVDAGHLETAISAIRALHIAGLNVTIPYKESVISCLSELSEEAKMIGAVNTITVSGDRLVGHNTDGQGFIASLNECGQSVNGRSILIIGAGGAARAVAFSLARGGAGSILIANRTISKGKSLKEQIGKYFSSINLDVKGMDPEDLRGVINSVDMVVNTTSIGLMKEDPSPVPREFLHRDLFVCDLIYNPPDTELIRYAKELCSGYMNGSGMLIFQGAASFKLWTGIEPPVHVMRQVLQDALHQSLSSSRS